MIERKLRPEFRATGDTAVASATGKRGDLTAVTKAVREWEKKHPNPLSYRHRKPASAH